MNDSWRRALGCASAAIGLAATAHAGSQPRPQVVESIAYYEIRGSSARQLVQQMRALGPPDRDGHRAFGQTIWRVKWKYSHVRDRSGCRTGPVKTIVTVTMQLPKWVPVSAELEPEWNRFSRALLEHENGHRDNGVETAREIAEALSAMRPRASCDELERDANEAAARLLQLGRNRDEQYEWKTNYGATQGVRLR